MTNDMEQKREFVRSLYPSPRWHRRVRQMTDAQVIAIFLREHQKPHDQKSKPKESEPDAPPF